MRNFCFWVVFLLLGAAGSAQAQLVARGGQISIVVGKTQEVTMSVARVTEIKASSTKSFEDAIEQGIDRANQTLANVKGAWVASQEVVVNGGKISEYRVQMKVTFILK